MLKPRKFFAPLVMLALSACGSVDKKAIQLKTEDGFFVNFDQYTTSRQTSSKNNNKSYIKKLDRLVIIVPPTGGATLLDRHYARSMAKNGATVCVLNHWQGQNKKSLELGVHQYLHQQGVRAIELTLSHYDLSIKSSVMGTSVGGLFSSIAASQLERIERVLVIGAGAPIPEVIVKSDQKAMEKLKEKRKIKFDFKNDEEYLAALSRHFSIDPVSLPQGFRNKELAVYYFSKDKTVPANTQKRLLDLWQPRHSRLIEAGHIWGIVSTWLFYQNEVESFLVPESPI